MSKIHLAIIDDDQEMRSLLRDFFRSRGYETTEYESAFDALQVFESDHATPFDLIISDVKMPKMDGMTFVQRLKEKHVDVPVILITAFGSIEAAIEAIRIGAYDYVVKPFKLTEMKVTVERAIEYRRLLKENHGPGADALSKNEFAGIIGKSPAMKNVFELISRVSHANANVLIMGESGTGKEIVAKAIHETGPRAERPFVAINCTAIPETLLESELFGHAKGSFTGANQTKRGLFEEANGGTLFLDEIGDMDPSLQAKLLRVLQEKKIRAVGENRTKDIDVRLIAATHQDLKGAIKDGRFREDLYYRLAVIPLQIPSLRHRKEDIPLLAEHFLKKYSQINHMNIKGFADEAMAQLVSQKWPGNVRELENIVERAVVLCRGEWIDDLNLSTSQENPEQFTGQMMNQFLDLHELEKRYIRFVLEKTGGKKGKAAKILGINRRTLYRKEREYGFEPGLQTTKSTPQPTNANLH